MAEPAQGWGLGQDPDMFTDCAMGENTGVALLLLLPPKLPLLYFSHIWIGVIHWWDQPRA